ncbi:3'-5' exonuclease [Azohydromonas caseinilytica]|uniref:3'-5' exonuclease n=1 Tax=Azohydromonas caseinilytica TaxID=2728836 RepID=A0A848FF46_9BURK|nr:3'-5' exonuclease [Azohydromonas caseinilytica]NML18038.1 3'-5' exonuclease [Azohydromonas caseinilytica]
MERVAVLDFETTGISPGQGDRPTEVAIALVENGCIVDRFQSLMNPGRRIPAFVTQLTGISNDMVAGAPAVAQVMREAARFVGRLPVVAHNAAFDRKFWVAELQRLALDAHAPFACTMLLARRLYPDCANHKLGTLVDALGLPQSGRAHRAMVDAEMASHLWCRIGADVAERYRVGDVSHALLARVQATPRARLAQCFPPAGAALPVG